MNIVAAVVGNSSSGVTEAPLLGVPSVNIGPRQAGRRSYPSVHDCDCHSEAIAVGIKAAMAAARQPPRIRREQPRVASQIKDVLKSVEIPTHPSKRFWDLDTPEHERTAT